MSTSVEFRPEGKRPRARGSYGAISGGRDVLVESAAGDGGESSLQSADPKARALSFHSIEYEVSSRCGRRHKKILHGVR